MKKEISTAAFFGSAPTTSKSAKKANTTAVDDEDELGSAGAKKKPRGTMLQDVMGDAKIRKRTKEQFGKIQAVKALSARPRKGERGAARSSKGKKKKR